MQARLELYEVPEVEAQRFACNAVILGKDVVIPSGCKETEAILKSLGFNPHSVDMNEFIKAGGAAKCCVLKLGS
jgi:N-dimethylarginine dimethylaminohydrolase